MKILSSALRSAEVKIKLQKLFKQGSYLLKLNTSQVKVNVPSICTDDKFAIQNNQIKRKTRWNEIRSFKLNSGISAPASHYSLVNIKDV